MYNYTVTVVQNRKGLVMKCARMTLAAVFILLTGCAVPQHSGKDAVPTATEQTSVTIKSVAIKNAILPLSDEDGKMLPETLMETYYLSSEDPVKKYLQNKSIQKFFNMWLKEYMCEDIEAYWDYDSLASVQYLDHKFTSVSRPGEEFYTCTFSTDDGRCGYIIVLYGEGKEGPYIAKRSLQETTPYLYDMRANSEQIAAALGETDIDIPSTSAIRVEWIDTDKNRGDRIILFTDGKGDKYICYLGADDVTVEKH